jgi:hypothetical protein
MTHREKKRYLVDKTRRGAGRPSLHLRDAVGSKKVGAAQPAAGPTSPQGLGSCSLFLSFPFYFLSLSFPIRLVFYVSSFLFSCPEYLKFSPPPHFACFCLGSTRPLSVSLTLRRAPAGCVPLFSSQLLTDTQQQQSSLAWDADGVVGTRTESGKGACERLVALVLSPSLPLFCLSSCASPPFP